MQLTKECDYAVRCVLYLATLEKNAVGVRRRIAEEMDIPAKFLSKIAQRLAKAGIIEILRGRSGGFRLLREPKDLSLLEVIEAIGGEVFLNECVLLPESCRRSPDCSVHKVWTRAKEQLRETLSEAVFSDLVKGESCLPVPVPRSD